MHVKWAVVPYDLGWEIYIASSLSSFKVFSFSFISFTVFIVPS